MIWKPRVAKRSDILQLEELIPRSSYELQKNTYTRPQIQSALGPVFGVDEQLIEDNTYFVVEDNSRIIGCGGWSFRNSLYGGSSGNSPTDPKLDPNKEAARVRAFFIDPSYARKGIGSAIMQVCEEAIRAKDFKQVEISATLVGELFYAKFGYQSVERYEIPLKSERAMTVVKMVKQLNCPK